MKAATSLSLALISLFFCATGCHGISSVTVQTPALYRNNFNETSAKKKDAKKRGEVVCVDGVCHISRGGSLLSDEEYENEDEYYDEEELPPPRKRPPPRSRPSIRGPPPERRGQVPPPGRRGPPPQRGRYPPPRRSRKSSALSSATGLAKKTVGLTTTAAVGTIKGSGKAALYLVSPKHVTRREVWGVWRLDQQVNGDSDTSVSCAANVELTPRGDVLVKYKDQTFETTYLFREKSWPQSCSIEFEARAFQGPNDDEPVVMRYKGYFRRKLADSQVIKIVGHIYELPRKGLWRGGRTGRKVGTFVARRRLVKRTNARPPEEELDEYDDEEYDMEELDEEEEYDEVMSDYDDGYS